MDKRGEHGSSYPASRGDPHKGYRHNTPNVGSRKQSAKKNKRKSR